MSNNKELEEFDRKVQNLLWLVSDQTIKRMNAPLVVDTKSSSDDLVTNVDQQNERLMRSQLMNIDPSARIVGEEESFRHQLDQNLSGNIWIIDPIDGTLNFVKQRDHFAIMLALYCDGQPTLGYIMDVMNKHLYHAWRGHGAYVDNKRLAKPVDAHLDESLIAINGWQLMKNNFQQQEIARRAAGLRMYGSAGIEIVHVLKGQLGGYTSRLKPWDIAAGRVIAEELGLIVKTIDDQPINVLSSNTVLVATKKVCQDIWQITK
ncbi:inositol monophosphatase family protein [Limosilactobacillus fastidiosus]|uniref:Inositol monophosphatase family protein n=1 Tax=Limosilactobacillus fastidiosus TaxID=2759855 RepID=A0ABR6E7R5_9LACO|nr:inositol monophosphatase family protein [Limosilactobacillus fastidiosus]MBB1062328.1 inositol monophosphatase family protein [Limosilactobacillus fastidiosus]MCD7083405.1 inositol monophosphatase family protein [Limosilactobacillus fastidiosus]